MKVNRYMGGLFAGMALLLANSPSAEESSETPAQADIRAVIADDVINLDGVQIRGNKELPQILYIVPWQEVETARRVQEQDIMLYSLSERRIKPVMPDMNGEGVSLR